jgi:hypothetical protein
VHYRAFLVNAALAGEIFSYQLERALGGGQSRSRRGGVEIIDVVAGHGTLDIQIARGL